MAVSVSLDFLIDVILKGKREQTHGVSFCVCSISQRPFVLPESVILNSFSDGDKTQQQHERNMLLLVRPIQPSPSFLMGSRLILSSKTELPLFRPRYCLPGGLG